MSASSDADRAGPSAAIAAARLTVTLRLADAALAGRDREDPGQRAGLRERDLARPGCRRAAASAAAWRCSVLITSSSTDHACTPGSAPTAVGDALGERVLHRAAADGQVDADARGAVGVDDGAT